MEARRIFDGILEKGLERISGKDVGEVKRAISRKTRSVADKLRAVMGSEFADRIEAEEQKWVAGITYDDAIRIDTIAEDAGASGMHRMGTRVTTLDVGALNNDRDRGYWERVEKHEGEHGKQSAAYNTDGIDINGVRASITDLVEWGAITASDQPGSDLTAGYHKHREIGDKVAHAVGKETLMRALHSGDLLSIQQEIHDRSHPVLVA